MIELDDDRAVASHARSRHLVIAALGIAQTLAWGSSYYLPAILADPIAAELGGARELVLAAFSMALLIAAFVGPWVGTAIDRRGGRNVLALSNLVLATGLAGLAAANGPASLLGAWAVLGVGMALGLYDAGFATLTSLYGRQARGPITGITLFAGFASTVSWPLTAALNDALGWRETCLVWAVLNLVIGFPLIACCRSPPRRSPARPKARKQRRAGSPTGRCCCSPSCSRPSGS
jgi:MFS family permease